MFGRGKFSELIDPLQFGLLAQGLRRLRLLGVVFSFLTIFASVVTISGPLVIVHAVGSFSQPPWKLLQFFALYAMIIAVGRVAYDAKTIVMNRIEKDISSFSHDALFHRIITADGSLFLNSNSSKLSLLLSNFDISNKTYLQMFLMVITGSVSDVAISIFVVGREIHWLVAIFVVGYGLLTIWVTVLGNKKTKKYLSIAQKHSAENANLLGNVISNIVSIKVYGGQSWIAGMRQRNYAELTQSWKSFYAKKLGYSGVQGLLIFMQYCGAFGALLFVHNNTHDFAPVLLLVLILGQLNRPFEVVGTSLRDFAVAKSLAEPLIHLIGEHAEKTTSNTSNDVLLHADQPPTIRVESLTKHYPHATKLALNKTQATFTPGKMNFIIGPSGAGKSTLMNILLKMDTRYEGEVTLDGTPLKNIEINSYWQRVGYVPQEPLLMNLTIMDNILLGRTYSTGEVEHVVDQVGLVQKISSLPGGLECSIGEGGRLLSVGERQRLSIARALIGQPRILLLDEASSALDAATEAAILAILRNLAEKVTIIAITHRQETVTEADNVLELSPHAASVDGTRQD